MAIMVCLLCLLVATAAFPAFLPVLGALIETVTASARLLLPTAVLWNAAGEYKLCSERSSGANRGAAAQVKSTICGLILVLLLFPLTPAAAKVFVTVRKGLCAGGLTGKDNGNGDLGGFAVLGLVWVRPGLLVLLLAGVLLLGTIARLGLLLTSVLL